MFKSKTSANTAAKKVLTSLNGRWKLRFMYDYYSRVRKRRYYFELSRGRVKIRQYNQRYFYVSIAIGVDEKYCGASGFTLKSAMMATLNKIHKISDMTKKASNKVEGLIKQLNT